MATKKEIKEIFISFYNRDVRTSVLRLWTIVQAGRTLKKKDVKLFWKTFKKAQEEAFLAGVKAAETIKK